LPDSDLEKYAKLSQLQLQHAQHLIEEGFNAGQIARWVDQGLQSLSSDQAKEKGFKTKNKDGRWISGAGLYFPFVGDFGQIRLDVPIDRQNGAQAKYLITEGAKDAAAGTLHGGIPTGAIAGVSHYRALKEGTGYTILFDADGWVNASVFSNLFHAAKWVGGKVQLLPEIKGYPKAGLCEYFKAGHTSSDYKALIESAKKPETLLMEWGKHFGKMPESRLSQAIRVALRLAAEFLDDIEQDALLCNIKGATKKVSAKTLSKELEKQKAKVSSQQRKKLEDTFTLQQPNHDPHPEALYRSISKQLKVPFENCVTAQSFDGWVYRKEFGASEGDWMVIDSAFYHWDKSLGYWGHQPDNWINAQIADAGETAFKLKHSKEFGWQVVKPYESNSYKESAFKYCRSRLDRPGQLPNNTHLRAFKNCVVDLRTGARMPHDKEYYLTSFIPYGYAPGKECPEVFRQFIADSFGEDMLPIIRAFTSMFLDPTAPYGRFPHLIGQSGGGKGTLGRFWNSLFGEDGASSGDFSNLSTAEGRHQYLTGKSIFAIPDAGGYVSGLRAFYELVDNGGMSGRALFNPVGYFKTWNVRFWVASVDFLQVENTGDGWLRRSYPIPVRPRTVRPDPDLRLKLEACKADVISWALAMPREERDRILLSPPENERIVNLTLDSALYGDSTKSFVDLCLRPSENAISVPNHLLHSWYVAYCVQHGYTPLGMSKFISHLKTILPRNFAERGWTPMVNGKRDRVAAHWQFIAPVEGAFMKPDTAPNNPFTGKPTDNATWICIKAACEEGGLMDFENFWNPPQPPPENSDNNCINTTKHQSPLSPLPPTEPAQSVQAVQGGTDFAESLKQRNSGGVQGVQAVQGIGLHDEKNAVCVAEKLEVEKSLTSVTGGGQTECRVDSFNTCHEVVNHDEMVGGAEIQQDTTAQSEVIQDAVVEDEPFMTEEDLVAIAKVLNSCPDQETLGLLRECWSASAMNLACKRLSPEKHSQIKAWVIELNATPNQSKEEEPVQAQLFAMASEEQVRHMAPGDWEWES
jgi:phage/plasmid-associated DNA primase